MYIAIPMEIVTDSRLVPNAKLLYGIIKLYSSLLDYCTLTNAECCDMLNISGKQTSALISQLVCFGYLSREIVRNKKTNEVEERRLYPRV